MARGAPGRAPRAEGKAQASRSVSRTAAAATAAAAHPHRTTNPARAERCDPVGWPQKASPALDGRYGPRLFDQLFGNRSSNGGMTKNSATRLEIPAAVLRSS